MMRFLARLLDRWLIRPFARAIAAELRPVTGANAGALAPVTTTACHGRRYRVEWNDAGTGRGGESFESDVAASAAFRTIRAAPSTISVEYYRAKPSAAGTVRWQRLGQYERADAS